MSQVSSQSAFVPAGGGPFALERLTIGVFLNDQPTHRLRNGSDKVALQPLKRHEGWILPAGSTGLCEFDSPLEVRFVSVEQSLLHEAGLRAPGFAPHVGALDPALLGLALGAEAFASGGTLYRETMHRALAAQLAQVLAPPPPESVAVSDQRLRRVLAYIHDQLADDLSLAAMADLAAMNQTHFSKAFKKALGLSPLQYVIKARLERAAVLLRSTDLTVADVAWRVGYGDLSRFGQHFKRQFGTTPARFRTS